MIQPFLYLLFPSTITHNLLSSHSEGGLEVEDEGGGVEGISNIPAPRVDIANLLQKYPPDSIYLASGYALALVDLGDFVIVWVGDHYSYALEAAKAAQFRMQNDKESSASLDKNNRRARDLICLLYEHAQYIAGITPNGSHHTQSNTPYRYPYATVLVIKQYSPQSRLLFTRLSNAQTDTQYLIRQYCSSTYLNHTLGMMKKHEGKRLAGNADKNENSNDRSTDHSMTAKERVEKDMGLFMDSVAYLPPTDAHSFLKYVGTIAPGIIQKFSLAGIDKGGNHLSQTLNPSQTHPIPQTDLSKLNNSYYDPFL